MITLDKATDLKHPVYSPSQGVWGHVTGKRTRDGFIMLSGHKKTLNDGRKGVLPLWFADDSQQLFRTCEVCEGEGLHPDDYNGKGGCHECYGKPIHIDLELKQLERLTELMKVSSLKCLHVHKSPICPQCKAQQEIEQILKEI